MAKALYASVLSEFEAHAERMRKSARERRESVSFRNCVDDNVEREAVAVNDTLGKAQPGDKFAGDTNLRTLRTLLSFIDERGWERCASARSVPSVRAPSAVVAAGPRTS